MIYFTADLHFNHSKILEYCNRPFNSVEEMNITIINNWNKTVNNTDTAIVLGDIGFGNPALGCIKQLNGTKILIRGNHDRGFSDSKLKSNGFVNVYKKPVKIHIGELKLFAMHAPRKFMSKYINLCGHVHEKWKYKNNYYNVGVDLSNFTPIPLNIILKHFKI